MTVVADIIFGLCKARANSGADEEHLNAFNYLVQNDLAPTVPKGLRAVRIPQAM